jgi:plasmid stabilization system protein ParE
MAARVITTPDAEQDIADAADWYARDRPGREAKFLARVNECMTTTSRVPRGGRPLRANYRRAAVRHFPYIVVYTYDGATDTVTVHAVSHTSRDPDDLLRRLP